MSAETLTIDINVYDNQILNNMVVWSDNIQSLLEGMLEWVVNSIFFTLECALSDSFVFCVKVMQIHGQVSVYMLYIPRCALQIISMLQHLINCFLQSIERVLVEFTCIGPCSVSKIVANLTMICHVKFEKYHKRALINPTQSNRFFMIAHMPKHLSHRSHCSHLVGSLFGQWLQDAGECQTSVRPLLLGPQISTLRPDFGPHALK